MKKAVLIALIFLVSGLGAIPARPSVAWQSKVDAWALAHAAQGPAEYLVYLTEQADLRPAAALGIRAEKNAYVVQRLSETAHRTQAPLLAALKARGLEVRPYWIANMLWVRADPADLEFIAARPDVAHVYANPSVHLDLPSQSSPAPYAVLSTLPAASAQIQWNIQKVNAPSLWAAGLTGQGVVIGGQDTGYQWDHPAIKNQYRGWNGATADHNYNWHDAIHTNDSHTSPGNPCGFDAQAPCDDNGHGTHTMGTMVGDDGQGGQIGMAPGARWIGCRNMEQGWGSPASYTECFQWFIQPTDLAGQNPRPDLAPDVINNSWACPSSEGCNWDSLQTIIENVRAAGIFVVVSAGNNGPGCSTVGEPPAIFDASFSVGATDGSDNIAYFSSRGPVTIDGSNRLKPDVSAPGVNVYSSYPTNNYTTLSGTSMAGPHVAGLAALMISADPTLRDQVASIADAIKSTALHLTTSQNCGSVPGSQVPNNTFGYGRIDACIALQAAAPRFFIHKTADPPAVIPGEQITYTLTAASFYPAATGKVEISETLPAGAELISASLPPKIEGNTLQWEIPSLNPCANQSIEFTVKVSDQSHGTVDNLIYSVHSEDHPAPVFGAPISTLILIPKYFPLVVQR